MFLHTIIWHFVKKIPLNNNSSLVIHQNYLKLTSINHYLTLKSFFFYFSQFLRNRLHIFGGQRREIHTEKKSGEIEQHRIKTNYFPEINGVGDHGKIVTYYPNSSGVESFGFAGFFVFEGEKVSTLNNLESIDILKQLHHPNVIKPYFRING